MKNTIVLLLSVFFSLSVNAQASGRFGGTVMAKDAKAVVGKVGLLCGKAAQIRKLENVEGTPTYIYFDSRFPAHNAAVRIEGSDLESFKIDLTTLQDKLICAYGRVERSQGNKFEVKVSKQSDLKLGQ